MKKRIKNSLGRTTKAAPWLLAMFTAAALAVTSVMPSFQAENASAAANRNPSLDGLGANCAPTNKPLGGSEDSVDDPDHGVATWVNGSMFVGAPNNGETTYGKGNEKPLGSYAVEAEGLTLVNGKLLLNGLKNAWPTNEANPAHDGRGFRFGIVGFGAQFRPGNGSDVLVVGGNDTKYTLYAPDKDDSQKTNNVSLLGYPGTGRGFIADIKSASPNQYNADIAGPVSIAVDSTSQWAMYADSKNNTVNWNADNNSQNPIADVTIADVTRTDYTDFQEKDVEDLSDILKGAANTSENGAGVKYQDENGNPIAAEDTGAVTYKDFRTSGTQYQYGFNFNEKHRERLITFTGDGTDNMQVFTIPGSALSNGGYTGVSFRFENIKKDTPVVINVTGSDSIEFNNGWRFWWPGDNGQPVQIGNGYASNASTEVKDAYTMASKSIMWNFADTTKLTIRGGIANEGTADGKITNDDPAAAMLGSIMVPNGTFESHVTTNGRVWVGGDFYMYNPDKVFEAHDGGTSSVLNMDQERHNYPWSGSLSADCAVISWNKVKADVESVDFEDTVLGGTKWAIFNSLDAAKKPGTTGGYVKIVTDNNVDTGDWDSRGGRFRIQSLKPGANYYLKEVDSGQDSGYKLNPNIYLITTGAGGSETSNITGVWAPDANETFQDVTGEDNTLLVDGTNIQNEPNGANLTWGKYSSSDKNVSNAVALSGSKWLLTKTDEDPNQKWVIEDDVTTVSDFYLKDGEGNKVTKLELTEGESATLYPVVEATGNNKTVTWDVHSDYVTSAVDHGNLIVTALRMIPEGEEVVIKASVAGTAVTVPVTITANQDVTGIVIVDGNGEAYANNHVSLTNGNKLQLNAVMTPEGLPKFEPTWVKKDGADGITVGTNGLLSADGTIGDEATICAVTGNGQKACVTVSIGSPTTFYLKWDDRRQEVSLVYTIDGQNPWTHDWSNGQVMDSLGNGYWSTTVNNNGMRVDFLFRDRDGKKVRDANYSVDGSSKTYYVDSAAPDDIKTTAPAITRMKTMSMMRSRSLMEEEQDDSSAEAQADTAASAAYVPPSSEGAGVLLDTNPEAGKFEIKGLKAGTYTLQEIGLPNGGYLWNPHAYEFEVDESGITWASNQPDIDIVNPANFAMIYDNPGEISFDKYDLGYENSEDYPEFADIKNPLGGTEWSLEEFNGTKYVTTISEIVDCDVAEPTDTSCANQNDKDPAKGKFRITGLKAGKYRLHEDKAPGMDLDSSMYYYFELTTTSSGVQLTASASGFTATRAPNVSRAAGSNEIDNYRQVGQADWTKVYKNDQGESQALDGATWTLQYSSYDKNDENKPLLSLTCVISKSNTDCGDDVSVPNWAKNTATQQTGQFALEGLPWGDYVITEHTAPSGYNLDTTPHPFVIGPAEDGYSFTANLGEIENTPGVILPETGGEGTTWIVMLGIAFTALAMMGCGLALRRRTV